MSTPPVPARPAATLLLVRDGAAGPEVFMLERHQASTWGGARVFPGGRLDPADAEMAAVLTVPGVGTPAMAFRVAAIRECFEECGILLARPRRGGALVSEREARALNGLPFADALARAELVPAVDLLVPYAHWITPVIRPKRFDTHFFITAAPPDQIGIHDGHESVASVWDTPAQLLAAAAAGACRIEFATRLNLSLLLSAPSAEAAIAAARARRIVTVMPEIRGAVGSTRTAHIPADAGYGGAVFPMDH